MAATIENPTGHIQFALQQEVIIFWSAVTVSVLHLIANFLVLLPDMTMLCLHWGSFAFLFALLRPFGSKAGGALKNFEFADIALAMIAIICAFYAIYASDLLYDRGVSFIWSDWLFSILTLVIALELARRSAGMIIPVMILIGLSYMTWLGPLVPGVMTFSGLSAETVLFRAYFETNGIFGDIARISATYVFMFILLGTFMIQSGGGDFIIEMARLLAGRIVGGPGIVAVVSSSLTGMISGSAVANTVSTGIVTIPLMKRSGYPARFAAGIEAAASTGGQLMPPVMGAGAFVMASYTQISYLTIISIALLPALLYFLSLIFWVRIEANKDNIAGMDAEPRPFREIFLDGGFSFLAGLATLFVMLLVGFTPVFSAGIAILSIIIASQFSWRPLRTAEILDSLSAGAIATASTAVLLTVIGLVVMSVTATGMGNTISLMLAEWAGGNLFIAIVLVAIASLVLGMGLPVTASYIVLGTLSAPALYTLIADQSLVGELVAGTLSEQGKAVMMLASPDAFALLAAPMDAATAEGLIAGLPDDIRAMLYDLALSPATLATALLSAHMIIFWLSQDSNVTPPVCLTAFAAASIAGTPPMRTGLTAWRLSKGIYIIPFLFAYTPILSGDWMAALPVFFYATIGLYAIIAAWQGYAEAPVPGYLRPVLAVCGLLLISPVGHLIQISAACAIVGLIALLSIVHRPGQTSWLGN